MHLRTDFPAKMREVEAFMACDAFDVNINMTNEHLLHVAKQVSIKYRVLLDTGIHAVINFAVKLSTVSLSLSVSRSLALSLPMSHFLTAMCAPVICNGALCRLLRFKLRRSRRSPSMRRQHARPLRRWRPAARRRAHRRRHRWNASWMTTSGLWRVKFFACGLGVP